MTALAVISALVYLTHIRELSFYRDDWYYMYDGLVGQGKIFLEMFRHLRPARGPLFQWLFDLFGANPQPFLLLLYLWRLLSGIGTLWLFRILWPQARSAAFVMAVLYLLYPGFLWWVQGFEYQPMVLSAMLQVFSIVFTLKAVQAAPGRLWWVWAIFAIVSGLVAYAFVEYAIGMEVFRWLCIYLLVYRRRQAAGAMLRRAAVTLVAPLGFLFWHQFLFDNQRRAADLSVQMGGLFSNPGTVLWWIVHLFQSLVNVLGFAWALPFYQNFFTLRLRDGLLSVGLMVVVGGILLLVRRFMAEQEDKQVFAKPWQPEAVVIGLVGAAAGVLPIVIANRVVSFERFSHYALPASLASVSFVVGLAYLLADKRIRMAVLAVLIGIPVLTHSALAFHARAEGALIQKFWHQAAWRIPGLKPGTVLVVNYAGMDYQEGNDIVWGPANFIYYPQPQRQVPIVISIAAARMEADTTANILEGAQLQQEYIVVNDIQYDFDNLLVLTLPSENSCLHVLDQAWAEISVTDPALIALAAPRSDVENVLLDGEAPVPPQAVFGAEPPRDWCYYYQRAQLARQRGDWAQVASIAREVEQAGLQPNDQIEWMPFLQFAAFAGDEKLIKQISTRINTQPLYKQQACHNLQSMHLTPEVQTQVQELFCGGGN